MADVPRPSFRDWPVNRDRHRAWWEDNPGQVRELKNQRDRRIVELALGLEGDSQLSYSAIGRRYGISGTRVIQIVSAAPGRSGMTEKERAALQGRNVTDASGVLIEELGLGMRSYNLLRDAGFRTVAGFADQSEASLLAIPRFGKKSLDELVELLHNCGISLREA